MKLSRRRRGPRAAEVSIGHRFTDDRRDPRTDYPDRPAIAETAKDVAEQRELEARARNFGFRQWQLVVIAIIAGAASFGAGAAFVKLLIG
jgi:hypothetical protein